MVTLVAGGCGIVGSGVVLALVRAGAKCWVPARSEARFDELKKVIPANHHAQLGFVKADLANENECERMRDEILNRDKQLNHVVASIGGWRTNGPLSQVKLADYKATLDYLTLPHFVVYKTFVKHLSQTPKSTYTLVTGGSGDVKFFDPNASLLPIGAGQLYGFYTSAMSEMRTNKNLSLIQYRVYTWVRKQADKELEAKKAQLELGHDYVGKFVPKLILKHKSEIYKLPTRSQGDKLFESL